MGNEASKTKELMRDSELKILQGKGIDIGCGIDPIMPTAKAFDMNDGDANIITRYVNETYDYVFSSHCLEHMYNPEDALQEWWKLVKEGGHLIFTVPDEDLYEQGYFPSLFNEDHKHTFTISKKQTWSPVSFNILELIQKLDKHELIQIEVQDWNFKRSHLYHSVYSRDTAFRLMQILRKFSSVFKIIGLRNYIYKILAHSLRLPMDQTHNNSLAQIFICVKKI